jgi:hypothetical protein
MGSSQPAAESTQSSPSSSNHYASSYESAQTSTSPSASSGSSYSGYTSTVSDAQTTTTPSTSAYGATGSNTSGSDTSNSGNSGYGGSNYGASGYGASTSGTSGYGAASGTPAATSTAPATDPLVASSRSNWQANPAGPAAGGNSNPAATDRSARSEQPPHKLAEVLRFDITVPWIIENWPRVSSGLSELNLHGYRVPLVTGTGESDLAGSLTYYFNKKQQLDRIIFHGTSGDPRPLITIVGNNFELERVIVNDPGLAFYQRKSWGKSHSELLIRPARVLRANDPHKRYEIEMALKRP